MTVVNKEQETVTNLSRDVERSLWPPTKPTPEPAPAFCGIVGRHPSMKSIFELIRRVASTDATALITGESGTGKELVARAIHMLSRRRDQRLVPVHCGAIPEELLESEMFGHERGAFTGAVCSRVGRFRLADNGTIFLDEIGDMSPKLQVKLLRVLEDGIFEPVGSVTSRCVNVRVIAATNSNLEEAVSEKRFREDLYYRLRVVPVQVPPLRRRVEDIPLLVEWFLESFHREKGLRRYTITDEALGALCGYSWPGNVRELKNSLEQLVVLGRPEGFIGADDLPDRLAGKMACGFQADWVTPPWEFGPAGIDFYQELARIEDRMISQALRLSGGNKKEAARLLRVNRTTLIEKLKRKRLKAEAEQAFKEALLWRHGVVGAAQPGAANGGAHQGAHHGEDGGKIQGDAGCGR